MRSMRSMTDGPRILELDGQGSSRGGLDTYPLRTSSFNTLRMASFNSKPPAHVGLPAIAHCVYRQKDRQSDIMLIVRASPTRLRKAESRPIGLAQLGARQPELAVHARERPVIEQRLRCRVAPPSAAAAAAPSAGGALPPGPSVADQLFELGAARSVFLPTLRRASRA